MATDNNVADVVHYTSKLQGSRLTAEVLVLKVM